MKINFRIFRINFKNIALFLLTFLILSCGKKTDIDPPKDYQKPNFENVID